MTIDLFFAGDSGTESRGFITLANGKLVAEGDTAKNLIAQPLVLGTNKGRAVIDPQEDPEKFLAELPEAVSSSRFWAVLRDDSVTASLELPIHIG